MLKRILVLTAFFVSACVTVNIYFPAAAVERAADQIVKETWGGPAGPANSRLRVQAGLVSYVPDYPAASAYLNVFLSCSAFKPGSATNQNWSEFCDRRIDAWIQRALVLQATDPYRANQLWARVDRAIVDQAPLVPLFSLRQVDFVSRRVGNYQFHPQWGILLDQLWVR